MDDKQFKKGIEGLKEIRMTDGEKSRVLEKVLSTPIKSPYRVRIPQFVLVCSLILLISFGGAVSASEASIPGDLFYPVKTRVVEPVLDVVNSAPEKKIIWEEEKITRRIAEAEKLVEKDKLDDKKLEELERKIEKSSIAFSQAVEKVASSTATSTMSRREKARDLRRDFRDRINDEREKNDREENNERKIETEELREETKKELSNRNERRTLERQKINRLKARAIKVLDEDDKRGRDSRDD